MTNEDRIKKYLTVSVNFVYQVISLSIHLSKLNSTDNSSFCHEIGSLILTCHFILSLYQWIRMAFLRVCVTSRCQTRQNAT